MKKRIETIACICSILFCIATLWSVTARGIFEIARFDVAHFDAGAGNIWLLVRGVLAVVTASLLGALVFFSRSLRSRLLIATSSLLIVPMFIWSSLGLERWAQGYSESSFTALLSRHFTGEALTSENILAEIGRPLFTGLRPTGETVWSYSYMPSSGFGWHKRIFWLQANRVTSA